MGFELARSPREHEMSFIDAFEIISEIMELSNAVEGQEYECGQGEAEGEKYFRGE